MYKVLIVDDERIIREGIRNSLDWESYGLSVCGIAENGLEAYEIIKKYNPNIVITDIKMPGMDGLELISKVHQELPGIVFIILSGYGEFEFANKAMKFGVKHYLLKPCDEDEILPVLQNVISELKAKEEKEQIFHEIDYNLKRVLPQAEEQFLREFLMGESYSDTELQYFTRLFNVTDRKLKLIILKVGTEADLIEKVALKNIAYEIIKSERICLSTTLNDSVIIVVKSIELSKLTDLLVKVKDIFNKYFKPQITIGVSKEDELKNIRQMYLEVQEHLKYEYDKYSKVIKTVIECVYKNIGNPKLSLNWIAKEVLFMNENYLGKLFYKETNKKFSHYVTQVRMEKAKELIESDKDFKIYEVTEQIGFEDNTQYFSQVFKKYTGYTPSEYKKLQNNER